MPDPQPPGEPTDPNRLDPVPDSAPDSTVPTPSPGDAAPTTPEQLPAQPPTPTPPADPSTAPKGVRKPVVVAAAATAAALLFGTVAVTQLVKPSPSAAPAATPAATAAATPAATPEATPTADPAPADDREAVVLEPVNDPGADPYTKPVAYPDRDAAPVDEDPKVPDYPAREPVVQGGKVGLYGGTSKEKVCDKDQLLRFLQENRGKAKAWVAAQNSDPDLRWGRKLTIAQLPQFIGELTPVIMRIDTRVVNHGYRRAGVPTTFNSVLQAGTKALVDKHGVVRARCFCGNPVIGPQASKNTWRYAGKKWKGFDPARVETITPSPKPLEAIPVTLEDGRTIYVRPGSNATEKDRVPAPNQTPSTDPTTAPTPAPAPDPTSAPTANPTPAATPSASSTRIVNDAFSFDRPSGWAVKSNVPGRVELFRPNGQTLTVSVEPAPSPDAVLNGYQNKLQGQCTVIPPRDEFVIGPYTVKRDRWNQPCPVDNTIAFTSPRGKTIFVEGTDGAEMRRLIATMKF